jgi:hypothetical protein
VQQPAFNLEGMYEKCRSLFSIYTGPVESKGSKAASIAMQLQSPVSAGLTVGTVAEQDSASTDAEFSRGEGVKELGLGRFEPGPCVSYRVVVDSKEPWLIGCHGHCEPGIAAR